MLHLEYDFVQGIFYLKSKNDILDAVISLDQSMIPPDAVISLDQRMIPPRCSYLSWSQISHYMVGQHWCAGWCMKGQSWNAWHMKHLSWNVRCYIKFQHLFISHEFKINYPTSYLTICKCIFLPQLVRTNIRLMCQEKKSKQWIIYLITINWHPHTISQTIAIWQKVTFW